MAAMQRSLGHQDVNSCLHALWPSWCSSASVSLSAAFCSISRTSTNDMLIVVKQLQRVAVPVACTACRSKRYLWHKQQPPGRHRLWSVRC